MGTTCVSGTDYPSGAPQFTPVRSGVRVDRPLVFCVVFCRSLFVLRNNIAKRVGLLQSGRHHHHYKLKFPKATVTHSLV